MAITLHPPIRHAAAPDAPLRSATGRPVTRALLAWTIALLALPFALLWRSNADDV